MQKKWKIMIILLTILIILYALTSCKEKIQEKKGNEDITLCEIIFNCLLIEMSATQNRGISRTNSKAQIFEQRINGRKSENSWPVFRSAVL